MYSTKKEIENWLQKMKIKKYVINEDLTVDVNGNVDISYKKLNKIPVKFKIINGYFDCSHNSLTNLEGCPEIIKNYFNCSKNDLTNLENAPKLINKNFSCSFNKLTSLYGCPEIIENSFFCNNNCLTNFEYFPHKVKNNILCFKNNIKEENLIDFFCNIDSIIKIYSDFNKDGNKEEFIAKVNYYKNIKHENELLTEISKNKGNNKISKKL